MVRLSNRLSYFYKYIFHYLGLALGIWWFIDATFYEAEIVLQFFSVLYIIATLFSALLFHRLSTYVFFDRQHLTIIAYKTEKGERKFYPIEDLRRVRENPIYTVLIFKENKKIRYLAKAPSFFEEDGESFISSLKKRAKKNRMATRAKSKTSL